MVKTIRRFKPGVARKVHVFSAALLWTLIGGLLLYRGVGYLVQGGAFWPGLPALVVGTLKSYFILDKSARSGLHRISNFSDNTCIGAVYSWKTWLVVLLMMAFGILVRNTSLPALLKGAVCIAIGWSLLYSSRLAWKKWANWKTEQ